MSDSPPQQRVAVLTGAARGIGEAMARLFSERGYAIDTRVNWLPQCLGSHGISRTLFEPSPRSLQPRRGKMLIFKQHFRLEEVTEPLHFGFNPFVDQGGG